MITTLRSAILATALCLGTAVAVAGDGPALAKGQTVYVPVYSHVLHGNQDKSGTPSQWLMAAMLSVRNTDPDNAMAVRSVRYYDSHGKLIREYPVAAVRLEPMGTTEVFVEHKDNAGGSGANFLVVWDADKPINPPIVETVHTYFYGTQSTAFVSRGQPLLPTR
ncbi:MAG: DUF3124 domain-containing protein [Actinomycetota bacterium]